jgi:hypothetical protein
MNLSSFRPPNLQGWLSPLATNGIWDTRFWMKPTARPRTCQARKRQPARVQVD